MSVEILLQNVGQELSQNFFETLISPFTSTLGVELTSLLIFGGIGMAYYVVQQSIIIPLVSLLLVGAVTIGRAPQSATSAITAMSVIAIASIGYILYTRARER